MKKLFAFMALSAFTSLSFAAPPSDESIKTLFKLMKTESMIDSVYANIEPAMRKSMDLAVQGKNLSAEQRKIISLAPQRLSQVLRSEMTWEKMEPLQIGIYRESYDQSEIDGLIEFYKTPVGQSFINKMPVVMQKSMTTSQAMMQDIMPKLYRAMEQVMAEAKLAPRK